MRSTLLALCCVLVGICAPAQQTNTTIRSTTELVLVPTVVHDRSGAHMPNLKTEDFSVQENGVEQKIAVCDEVRANERPIERTVSQTGTYTNQFSGSAGSRHFTIIALDLINTQVVDQEYARRKLLDFLRTWASVGEPMMVVTLTNSGVRVLQDFTADPKLLAAAVKRAQTRHEKRVGTDVPVPEPSGGASQMDQAMDALWETAANAAETFDASLQLTAIQSTLEAMQQLARALAGAPGRKSLIWASSGFPFSVSNPDTMMSLTTFVAGRASYFDVDEMYRRTWQLLNDAQIAVYPVDVRGLVVGGADAQSAAHGDLRGRLVGTPPRWNAQERLGTFMAVAQSTGGQAFFNTNDLVGAFRKATEDSTDYYLLGYYTNTRAVSPGWRRLKVAVKRSGVEVRARQGYFVAQQATTVQEIKREISVAMVSPLDATSVTFGLEWKSAEGEGEKRQVPYELNIPYGMLTVDEANDNYMKFDLEVLAKTSAGVAAKTGGRTIEAHLKPDSLEKLREGGLHFGDSIELPPGEYTVRVLVRDVATGRIGTVTAPVKVQ